MSIRPSAAVSAPTTTLPALLTDAANNSSDFAPLMAVPSGLDSAEKAIGLASGSVKSTKSGNNGVWKLTGIPAGTYTVTVSATGYPTRPMSMTAVNGQTVLGLMTLA